MNLTGQWYNVGKNVTALTSIRDKGGRGHNKGTTENLLRHIVSNRESVSWLSELQIKQIEKSKEKLKRKSDIVEPGANTCVKEGMSFDVKLHDGLVSIPAPFHPSYGSTVKDLLEASLVFDPVNHPLYKEDNYDFLMSQVDYYMVQLLKDTNEWGWYKQELRENAISVVFLYASTAGANLAGNKIMILSVPTKSEDDYEFWKMTILEGLNYKSTDGDHEKALKYTSSVVFYDIHLADFGESHLRIVTYQSLDEAIGYCTNESAQLVMQLVPIILNEPHLTLEGQKLSFGGKEEHYDLQDLIFGCLQVIIQRHGITLVVQIDRAANTGLMLSTGLRDIHFNIKLIYSTVLIMPLVAISAIVYIFEVQYCWNVHSSMTKHESVFLKKSVENMYKWGWYSLWEIGQKLVHLALEPNHALKSLLQPSCEDKNAMVFYSWDFSIAFSGKILYFSIEGKMDTKTCENLNWDSELSTSPILSVRMENAIINLEFQLSNTQSYMLHDMVIQFSSQHNQANTCTPPCNYGNRETKGVAQEINEECAAHADLASKENGLPLLLNIIFDNSRIALLCIEVIIVGMLDMIVIVSIGVVSWESKCILVCWESSYLCIIGGNVYRSAAIDHLLIIEVKDKPQCATLILKLKLEDKFLLRGMDCYDFSLM